jgi:hypothetical protein
MFMSTFSQEEMDQAVAVLNKVRDAWLQRDGVTAVDLGFKWSQGEMTQQLSIRVHVSQKRDQAELDESQLFPKEVEGIPVDVIEATYGVQTMSEAGELGEEVQLEAAKDGRDQRFQNNIPLGVSVGNPRVTAGTLGAKVFDAQTKEPMIISNWHVLVGDPAAVDGESIWQPGRLDGGKKGDEFATLTRSVLGPYDAAVARLTGERMVQTDTLEGDHIEDVATPLLGMLVWKSGRTTGRTEGFIDGVKMTVSINYQSAGPQILHDVVHIVPRPGAGVGEISMGGDSGSIWVDEASGNAVGLHFAGEVGAAPEHALANEIIPVIQQLDVLFPAQLIPTEPPPVEPPPVEKPKPDKKLSFFDRIRQLLRRLFG